ncbi:dihydrofolate reductase family protein [Streptomyces sp. CB01881]|uniref:dihydrofolate reductase family protein n=1 Tax=Streptomyces sp. CB01881 TaxID=2078691 RepID=UPI000CDBD734|nr:dihydrofolate reductase family protein [Streptomyces sp. CB01881]AUY48795.1 deaminase [Streptomyces sp. CB01881]TYC77284.1 dihydrofolate reductase [Streptomyces sp. CB01881]
MRKLTYFVGASIDGFIAAPDGGFDFLMPYVEGEFLEHLTTEYADTLPTPGRAAFGVADVPVSRFDTVLMGRGTYAVGLPLGLTNPYAHLRQIVFSRTLTSPDPAVEVTGEDPLTLVRKLKQEDGLGIWLCGGAELAGQLLPEVDELIVKQAPVVAGQGVPLFRADFAPHGFTLADCRPFENGIVVLTYAKRTGPAAG